MPPVDKALQRRYASEARYKQVENKWVINTDHPLGTVRPIDLVSRGPDVLLKYASLEAAVAFDEKCFQEKWEKKRNGECVSD